MERFFIFENICCLLSMVIMLILLSARSGHPGEGHKDGGASGEPSPFVGMAPRENRPLGGRLPPVVGRIVPVLLLCFFAGALFSGTVYGQVSVGMKAQLNVDTETPWYYDSLHDALKMAKKFNGTKKTITLLDDINGNTERDVPLEVASGLTVTLDLNGKIINLDEISGNTITVLGNLTLSDSGSTAAHSGELPAGGLIILGDGDNGVHIERSGSLTMTGGTIGLCINNGVYNEGTFTMTGGAISKNTYGVYNEGTFTMSASENSKPVITKNPYGVFLGSVNAIFNLEGGEITDNGSTDSESSAVYISMGKVNMSGGEISGNTSGGVRLTFNSIFTMSGGKISGNTSGGDGGGVNMFGGTFEMTAGEISGNTAGNYGGGVYVDGGTFNMTAGTITGNKAAKGKGAGVYVNVENVQGNDRIGTFTVSGNVSITGNTGDNVWLGVIDEDSYAVITVTDTLTGTIGVTKEGGTGVFGKKVGDYASISIPELAKFTSDEGYAKGLNGAGEAYFGYSVTYDANLSEGDELSGKVPEDIFPHAYDDPVVVKETEGTLARTTADGTYILSGWTINDGTDVLKTGQSFRMPSQNTTLHAQWEQTAVAVRLRVDSAYPAYYYSLHEALAAAEAASGTKKEIKLLSDINSGTEGDESLSVNTELTLDLNGYIIDLSRIKGRVIMAAGKLTLSDSNIHSAHSGDLPDGGLIIKGDIGVVIQSGGAFTMDGGTISGSKQPGVYNNKGTFTMNGGAISGSESVGVENDGIFDMNGGAISGSRNEGVQNYATFDMNGGAISGNGKYGVYNQGTFTMYASGTSKPVITKNDSGGVYLAASKSIFDMSGGEISGNTTDGDGGGVYLEDGSFTMSGGGISGNTAGGHGGGVYLKNGTFTMSSGEISGNTAGKFSGGVFVKGGTLNMRGGTITGNKAVKGKGAGVFINAEIVGGNDKIGIFTAEGNVSITGNTGDNVCLGVIDEDSYAVITLTGALSDGAEIGVNKGGGTGVFGRKGGAYAAISDADLAKFTSDEGFAKDLNDAGEAYFGYSVTYDANLSEGDTLSGDVPEDTVPHAYKDPVTVKETTGTPVRTAADGTVSFLRGWTTTADGSGTVYSPGETYIMGSASVTFYAKWKPPVAQVTRGNTVIGVYPSLKAAIDAAQADDTVKLLADVSRETEDPGYAANLVEINKNITLDLDGWAINAENKSRVLYIKDAEVTLTDGNSTREHDPAVTYTDPVSGNTVTVNGGAIIGGDAGYGGGVFLYGGSFVMKGGTIAGSTAGFGGGVNIYEGSFVMEGGTIAGNTASQFGGAGVYADYRSSFEMSGSASVSGNKAVNGSGGVSVENSRFKMSGSASVSGNMSTNEVGGVFVISGEFLVSGSAVVSGNTANGTDNNVYLPEGNKITVSNNAPLTDSADIGITMEKPGVFTSGYSESDLGAPSAYFSSDNTSLGVGLDGGEAALGLTVTYEADDATGGKVPVDNTLYAEGDPVTVLVTDSPLYKIASDGTVSVLSGWKLSGTDNIYQAGQSFSMPGRAAALEAQWGPAAVSLTVDGGEPVIYARLDDALKAAEAASGTNKTVTLLADISNAADSLGIPTVESSLTVTLDLNGKTIDLGGDPVLGNSRITVEGEMTLTDGSTDHTGTITNGDYGVEVQCGTFIMNGGTIRGSNEYGVFIGTDTEGEASSFEMNGGVITGNKGSGVRVSNGSFVMNDGTISDNESDDTNGKSTGVLIAGGSFTMKGGTISGNEGDGVEMADTNAVFTMSASDSAVPSITNNGSYGVNVADGTFNMSGGLISGNNNDVGSESHASGVNVGIYGTLNLSGTPVIKDNNGSNVYLPSGKTVTVTGTLDDSAEIGVTLADEFGVITSGLKGKGSAENFFSDAGYAVGLNGQGEAILGYEVTYDGNGYTGGTVPEAVVVIPDDPVNAAEQGDMVNEGHTFTGWNTVAVPSGTDPGTHYKAGDLISGLSGNLTLYAQWEITTYKVTFDTNGGVPASIDVQTVVYGKKAVKPADPSQENFVFTGWFRVTKDPEGGEIIAEQPFDFETVISDNISLRAGWAKAVVCIPRESGTTYYTTLADAVEAAAGGDTIRVVRNFTLNEQTAIGKKLTLDLNGKIISKASAVSIIVNTSGELTITDDHTESPGSISSDYSDDVTGDVIVNDGGTLNVTGGEINGPDGYSVIVNLAGKLSVSGTADIHGNQGIYIVGGSVTVSGGNVHGVGSADLRIGSGIRVSGGTLEVTGGYINGSTSSGDASYAIYAESGVTRIKGTGIGGNTRSIFFNCDSGNPRVYSETNRPSVASSPEGYDWIANETYADEGYHFALLKRFSITWKSQDGTTTLETDGDVAYGSDYSYDGEEPKKDADDEFTYTFAGWSEEMNAESGKKVSELGTVTGTKTFYAAFSKVTKTFTVTWKSQDGTTLETDGDVAYGSDYSYDGEEPKKDADDEFTYTFAGWSEEMNAETGKKVSELGTVTGAKTFYAAFSKETNTYTVTWKSQDGTTTLETDENAAYGSDFSYDGEEPKKDADDEFTYTFAGWSEEMNAESGKKVSELGTVTGTKTFYAAFSKATNTFTVTWKSQDGKTTLETDENAAYGSNFSYDGEEPKKDADDEFTYTFAGWSEEMNAETGKKVSELGIVTGTKTFYAAFSKETNTYTITWLNWNGDVLDEDEVAYGETPSYNGEEPKKDADEQYIYKWIGWYPEVTEVTGKATYTAVFEQQDKPAEPMYMDLMIYTYRPGVNEAPTKLNTNFKVELRQGKDTVSESDLVTLRVKAKDYKHDKPGVRFNRKVDPLSCKVVIKNPLPKSVTTGTGKNKVTWDLTYKASFAYYNDELKIRIDITWHKENNDAAWFVPLPEDEIGAYTILPDKSKEYLIFQTYDICMEFLGNEEECAGNERCYHKEGVYGVDWWPATTTK